MKRQNPFVFLLTILLLFTTFFALFNTIIHAQQPCEHSTCEHCAEMEEVEQDLLKTIKQHGVCSGQGCDDCVKITQMQELLQEKQTAEYTCHDVVCDACVRTALNRRLRTLICIITVVATAIVVFFAVRIFLKKCAFFSRSFTLFTLKVKIND